MPRSKTGFKRPLPRVDDLKAGVARIINKNMSLRDAAATSNVSKSALHRYLRAIRNDEKYVCKVAHKKIFHQKEEEELVEYLRIASELHCGLNKVQFRKLAYRFAVNNGKEVGPKWKENQMATKGWLHDFQRRHANSIGFRKPESTSPAHSTAFNSHTVAEFLGNYEKELTDNRRPKQCSVSIERLPWLENIVSNPGAVSNGLTVDISGMETSSLDSIIEVKAEPYDWWADLEGKAEIAFAEEEKCKIEVDEELEKESLCTASDKITIDTDLDCDTEVNDIYNQEKSATGCKDAIMENKYMDLVIKTEIKEEWECQSVLSPGRCDIGGNPNSYSMAPHAAVTEDVDHCFILKGENEDIEIENPEEEGSGKINRCDNTDENDAAGVNLSRRSNLHEHSPIKPYKCNHCDMRFFRKTNLAIHSHEHPAVKPFKCDHCDMSFYWKSHLIEHSNKHSGIKPYKCDQCGKSYSRKFGLNKHMAKHSSGKGDQFRKCFSDVERGDNSNNLTPLLDEFDGNSFLLNGKKENIDSEMVKIMKTGENDNENSNRCDSAKEKAFKCDQCEKSYTRKFGLNKHKTKHSNESSDQFGKGANVIEVKAETVVSPERCHDLKPVLNAAEGEFYENYPVLKAENVDIDSEMVETIKTEYNDIEINNRYESTAEKAFKCDQCEKCFPHPNNLRRHILFAHSSIKPYKCEHCEMSFSWKSHLIQHSHKHSGIKPYKCDHCDMTFIRKANLNEHSRIHLGIKPYKCAQCEMSFSRKPYLTEHMFKHSAGKPFKCDHCDKSFTWKSRLDLHLQRHSGLKPFKCDHCDSTFARKTNLAVHTRRRHSVRKPHKCDHCDMSFFRQADLTEHVHAHSGITPYKCDQCNMYFTRKLGLKNHIKIKHSGERVKPYKCGQCNKCFYRKYCLDEHVAKHENRKQYKCDQCGKCFASKIGFHNHKLNHSGVWPYRCDLCDRGFVQKSHLKEHLIRHSRIKPFKCDRCEEHFSLKSNFTQHMRVQHGVKLFKCDQCDLSFMWKSNLKQHIRLRCDRGQSEEISIKNEG